MYEKVEFIGREKELQAIQAWIDTPKQNVIIFLEADGGIGKTRMLQEIQLKYADANQQAIVSDIVDYDEYRYFTVSTMRNAIIKRIGEKYFKLYREMEKKNPLNKERLNHQFMTDFTQYEYDHSKKFVLLIDTAEKTQNAIFWDGFRDMLQDLKNMVVIIAGRSKDHEEEPFSRKAVFFENKIPKYQLEEINLKNFSPIEAKLYLDKKRDKNGIAEISENLVDCAIRLSKGNPIILDLTIGWILRDFKNQPDEFFLNVLEVDNCPALARRKPAVLKAKEKLLVTYFERNDNAITQMIHALLYVPRLKSDMLSYLFGDTISHEDFEDLKKYVFIKDAGQGYITLHDEMARLLNEYIRPEIDQEGILEQFYAQKTLPFYEKEISQLNAMIERSSSKFDLEKRRDYNKVERILNLFVIGDKNHIEQAINQSLELLTKAAANAQYSLVQYLFSRLNLTNIEKKLSLRQLVEFKTQQAKVLSTIGKPQEAKALLVNFEKEYDHTLSDFERANLRNMLAGIYAKLGEVSKAIKAQTFAYERLRDNIQIQSGLHLGIMYREMGKHNHALKYLNEILTLTKNLHNDEEKSMYKAHIFYHLANVYRVKGESILALRYTKEALEIWSDQKSINNIAKAHIMRGNIYREQDNYTDAEKAYQQAEEILEDDGVVYLELLISRARSKIFQEKWEESKEDLQEVEKRARKDGNKGALVHALSLLSSFYREQGDGKKARDTLEEYEELSQKHGNVYYQAEVLVSFVELDYQEKVDNLEAKIFERAEALEGYRSEYDFPKLFGKMKLYQAKVLFDNEKKDEAIHYYQEGFKELSRYEGYAIVDKELDKLLNTLKKWDTEEAIRYLYALEKGWESHQKLSQWCKREITFLELGV